jgi:hypothetical protein
MALLLLFIPLETSQAVTPTAAGGQSSSVALEPGGRILHRVVWSDYTVSDRGTHLVSANVDGTDRKSVYDQPRAGTRLRRGGGGTRLRS